MNLGMETQQSFKEKKSISILTEILEENMKIATNLSQQDKTPNLDGDIFILDNSKKHLVTISTQIKALPDDYKTKDLKYKYSCDTKVFNVVKRGITKNPVVLFLVDVNQRKIFWFHITEKYLNKIGFNRQITKTIHFDESNIYNEEQFLQYFERIARLSKELENIGISFNDFINNNSSQDEDFLMLQDASDYLNYIFTFRYPGIKNSQFPLVWKFGITYASPSFIQVFGIYGGWESPLINPFSIDDLREEKYRVFFTSYSNEFKPLRETLYSWINRVIIGYYNNNYECKFPILTTQIAIEICFNFNAKYQHWAFNNTNVPTTLNVKEIEKSVSGLFNFNYYILTNENHRFHNVVKQHYEATPQDRSIPYLNMFMSPNSEEEELLRNLSTGKINKKIDFRFSDVSMHHVIQAITLLRKEKLFSFNYQKLTLESLINSIETLIDSALEINPHYKFNNNLLLTVNAKGDYYIIKNSSSKEVLSVVHSNFDPSQIMGNLIIEYESDSEYLMNFSKCIIGILECSLSNINFSISFERRTIIGKSLIASFVSLQSE